MSFPAPVLPIVGPLLAAAAALICGRWRRVQTIIGIGACLILALATAWLPTGSGIPGQRAGLFAGHTWAIAMRPLVINEGLQGLFVFFFAALGLLFLFSFLFWQGSTFIPAGLAAIALLAAALMAQAAALAAILLVIAAATLVMSYAPVVRKETLGSLRYLLLFTLALAPLLLATWLVESGQAPLNVSQIVMMLAAAFAILLAGFPFYIWVYPVVAEAPFLVPGLLLGLGQTAVVVFIFSILQANTWIAANPQFQNWLTWSGTGTVLVATLLVLTAGKWRFLWGHLLLLNMGFAVLSLTLPQPAAVEMAISFHFTRFISLLLAGVALSFLKKQGCEEKMANNRGLVWRAPLTTAMLAYSFFSLLGTPLTLGFPVQWAFITRFGQQAGFWLSALLVLAMAISAIRVLGILARMIADDDERPASQETDWQRATAATLLLAALLLTFIPWPLLNYAKEISAALFG